MEEAEKRENARPVVAAREVFIKPADAPLSLAPLARIGSNRLQDWDRIRPWIRPWIRPCKAWIRHKKKKIQKTKVTLREWLLSYDHKSGNGRTSSA